MCFVLPFSVAGAALSDSHQVAQQHKANLVLFFLCKARSLKPCAHSKTDKDRQRPRPIDRERKKEGQTDGQKERQTDRQTEKQTDGQTDRETKRQTIAPSPTSSSSSSSSTISSASNLSVTYPRANPQTPQQPNLHPPPLLPLPLPRVPSSSQPPSLWLQPAREVRNDTRHVHMYVRT